MWRNKDYYYMLCYINDVRLCKTRLSDSWFFFSEIVFVCIVPDNVDRFVLHCTNAQHSINVQQKFCIHRYFCSMNYNRRDFENNNNVTITRTLSTQELKNLRGWRRGRRCRHGEEYFYIGVDCFAFSIWQFWFDDFQRIWRRDVVFAQWLANKTILCDEADLQIRVENIEIFRRNVGDVMEMLLCSIDSKKSFSRRCWMR